MSSSNDSVNGKILQYYRKTEPPHILLPSVKETLKNLGLHKDAESIAAIVTEHCFNIQINAALNDTQRQRLEWLLAETFERDGLKQSSHLNDGAWVVEFGPRMTFTSAFSSNATSICQACDLPVSRLELSRRYCIEASLSEPAKKELKSLLHDRMTEQEYTETLTTFDSGAHAEPVKTIPIMEKGRSALEDINNEMGLGFDDFDLDYYTELFKVCKNPI